MSAQEKLEKILEDFDNRINSLQVAQLQHGLFTEWVLNKVNERLVLLGQSEIDPEKDGFVQWAEMRFKELQLEAQRIMTSGVSTEDK